MIQLTVHPCWDLAAATDCVYKLHKLRQYERGCLGNLKLSNKLMVRSGNSAEVQACLSLSRFYQHP